jgi:hypothetical protein
MARPCIYRGGFASWHDGSGTDRKDPGLYHRKTVGQLGSSRSSGHQPEQLRGLEPALCKDGRHGGVP